MSDPSRRFRVLFAASEVAGFAKTGGLADVCAALPRALARRGHQVAVALPLYYRVRHSSHHLTPTGIIFTIPLGHRSLPGRIWRTTLPESDVPVYLVEQPELFERDDPAHGNSLYNFSAPGGRKEDYGDNAERFIFFCRAIMEALPKLDVKPEILHCNDWQTGLLPAYLKELYARSSHLHASAYHGIRTLLTIHNIAYQGNFPASAMAATGLHQRLFNHRQLEFYGNLSFLKSGCVFADRLSTVSPRYAEEIQTMVFGYGLEGLLGDRRDVLNGIVNGVDYDEWDPRNDKLIAATYDDETVFERKPANKSALQAAFGLPQRPEVPLLGVVARLAEQKGISLITESAWELLSHDVQLIVLGDGDPMYHHQFEQIRSRFPQKCGIYLGFNERLAHQVEAGADIFLMPSQFEPSGLNQLYSLRYGTVPVVRAVGGLYDTITDCTPETLAAGTATGFRFGPYTPPAFQHAVHRALACYWQQKDVWRQLVQTGMRQDWSWGRSATEYERLYGWMTGG
ncbi:MAG: glycogen synthase GlgA [Gemmataceae bacterium]